MSKLSFCCSSAPWLPLPALLAHASQFMVDGRDAIHSGGQREPLQLRTGVRRRA